MSHSFTRVGAASVASLIAVAGLALANPTPAVALAPVTVVDEASLRAAISGDAESILFGSDITVNQTLPTIDHAAVIDGSGHVLRVDPSPSAIVLPILAISAQGVAVTVRDLTLIGKPPAQTATSAGSKEIATYGVYASAGLAGTVSLTNVSVQLKTEAVAGIGVSVSGGAVVNIDGGTIEMTRPLADGNAAVAGVDVRDAGPGSAARVTITRLSLAGTTDPTGVPNKDSGIFTQVSGTAVEVTDTTIERSSFGIYAENGGTSSLSVARSTVDDCTFGGINLILTGQAAASIHDSEVTGTRTVWPQTSLDTGYGVRLASGGESHLSVERTTIARNAGTGVWGRLDASSALELTDTALSENGAPGVNVIAGANSTTSVTRTTSSANADGGLWFAATGGAPRLRVENSTVSGNTPGTGGGVAVQVTAPPGSGPGVEINNSTITANTGLAGLKLDGIDAVVDHTIVSGNLSAPEFGDVSVANGASVTGGWNLIGTVGTESSSRVASSALAWQSTRVGITDPGLEPLADNGGYTKTHALLPTSPALDTGDSAEANTPTTDQRGAGRVQGWSIDIGAYESALYSPGRGEDPPAGPPTRLASTGSVVDLTAMWVGAVALLVLGSALLGVRRRNRSVTRR